MFFPVASVPFMPISVAGTCVALSFLIVAAFFRSKNLVFSTYVSYCVLTLLWG